MTKCKNCLLPANAPGADLDKNSVCMLCRTQKPDFKEKEETVRVLREADLEKTLSMTRGKGDYDVLVCLSGGKDSVYLLHKLKVDYGLRVLAFTTDMNIPEVAWENMRRAVAKLKVDHEVFTPDAAFYKKLYRHLLTNQEERGAVRSVCYVCAPLFEGYALKAAVAKNIPLVVAGYSPGQPDPERMIYEFPESSITKVDWTPAEVWDSGLFSNEELDFFWNPAKYPPGTLFPRYLAPFHAWKYNQEETMKLVVELGLIANAKSASPVHSNCPLNWLLMYSDLKNLGYNPYNPEFSSLIRSGQASRSYWRITMPAINMMIRGRFMLGRQVTKHLKELNLKPSDLVLNRPKREEWPEDVRHEVKEKGMVKE